MMTCEKIELDRLLDTDADIETHDPEVARHVESCPHCQARLSQGAADATQWAETKHWLSGTGVSDLEYTESLAARERWKRPFAWNDAMAKSLLANPSHPEMLGRIGRYDVERLIGSGGMGVVFKAYDTELNRPVAIKLLTPYLAQNGSARKRFAREARAAAAVVDEHVVAIHNVEIGNDPEEAPFLVMKYVAGGSLQQRLDRDGPLDVCEILRIGMQTAKGLAAAHAQGLIHRDVKPSNILLDEGVERALLTDFGLARADDDACLTRSGFHPGTPHYMSPEQVRGDAIDGRSDLFGLGCVLYAICTGHPPFRAETSYAVMRRITDEPARPIREINSNIPEWLERIVMKLLSKSRNDRYDSADDVAELLEECLAHTQHPTTTPLPESVAALSPRRRNSPPRDKFVAAALIAFSVLFAGVLIVLELNKGTLTIHSDLADVPVRIIQGDEVVKKLTVTKSAESVRIATGNYQVEIDGAFDDMVVRNGSVSLRRGETHSVKIVRLDETPDNVTASVELPGTISPPQNTSVKQFENLPRDTQVHVVGCYTSNDQPINVTVRWTGKPIVVVLNSYNAASWNLNVDPAADVRGVILAGYFDQRFSHTAPSRDIPTIVSTYFPVWKGITKLEKQQRMSHCFYVWSPLEDEEFTKMQTVVADMTRRDLTTFQAVYTGTEFTIDGQLGSEELAIAKRWQAFAQHSDKSSIEFQRIEKQLSASSVSSDADASARMRNLAEKMNDFDVPQLTETIHSSGIETNAAMSDTDSRSLTALLRQYNDATAEERRTLFNPPIPDMTLAQLESALASAAEQYRKIGKHAVADALQETLETRRLADRLGAKGMMVGTTNLSQETGEVTFRQLAPGFYFVTDPSSVQSIVLSDIELRWSRDGWSSPDWGQIHPPISGVWELSEVEQNDATLDEEQFKNWTANHRDWSRIVIDESTLVMAAATPELKYDLTLDHSVNPQSYKLSRDGQTEFEGVFMGNGFIDDTELTVMVTLESDGIPKTFHTKDNNAIKLIYQRIARNVNDALDYFVKNEREIDAPRLSPFTDVQFEGDTVLIVYEDRTYEWLEFDGINVDDIVKASKQQFGERWQKRLSEDLVEVLWGMEQRPGNTVLLRLMDPQTSESQTIDNAAMTKENRSKIYRKRRQAGDD